MKKSKFFKRAAIIALSGVMAAGVVLSAAACGGKGNGGLQTNELGYRAGTPGRGTDANKLTVYIFCNDSDSATNRQICNEWMAKYNQAHGTNYSVDFVPNTDKADYFQKLGQYWSDDQMYDVIYLAPRYVRSYAETGSVLNIADYIDKVAADPTLSAEEAKTANKSAFSNIWGNALSYYAYEKGKASGAGAYTLGQSVTFNENDLSFHTAANSKVGLYGLPKDYSNFSTGYNRLFFSDAMKKAITSTLATTPRNVGGADNETSGSVAKNRKYTGDSGMINLATEKSVVQYAVTGTYDNPYTGETGIKITDGQSAPIINVGVPTRYFPYNFFRFDDYQKAVTGGDPMALMCEAYTNGEGYVVTIPGFPNDTFKLDGSTKVDEDALYDNSIGHITYTYAEYSALIWAMTYYLNTFNWNDSADGKGGVFLEGASKVVFGGEQYEGVDGAAGSVLYLLPWLYGNDADLIDSASMYCTSVKDGQQINPNVAIEVAKDWRNYVGNSSNPVSKMNLDGSYRTADVQFGFNTQNFIETYGAFLALASDWNSNNGGDTDEEASNNGWALFRGGRSLFYGAGSWDGATRNDSAPTLLEFGQMPTPVSEKYALYSKIKGANYTMEEYSNGATSKGSGNDANNDKVQRTDLASGKKVYSQAEIIANQTLRQDKWGARMDSVGYAVNGQVTNYTGEHAWKAEAAVSLAMALTIDRDAQVTLTYAGAQFPNFQDQMQQFVDYQKFGANGAFKDMLTPEGFSNMKYYDDNGNPDPVVAAQAKTIWDEYYKLALDMEKVRLSDDAAAKAKTVKQYLEGKTVNGAPVVYNHAFENVTFNEFVGSSTTSYLAYAMKIFNMVPLWRDDREINLRMQCGLNAVRDSTMYTYNDLWIGEVDARRNRTTMLAYRSQQLFTTGTGTSATGISKDEFLGRIKYNPAETNRVTFETPVVFCLRKTADAQALLTSAYSLEQNELSKLKG